MEVLRVPHGLSQNGNGQTFIHTYIHTYYYYYPKGPPPLPRAPSSYCLAHPKTLARLVLSRRAR
eukprot:16119514-Heterocapsa_arctica.AAC.1